MPTVPLIEHHFTATAIVRDIVIGMSDGLTVPFALAAGISAVGAATNVVVTAGLIPLSPPLLISNRHTSLLVFVIVTMLALLLFRFFKGRFTSLNPFKSGTRTILMGGLAAAVAFGLARLIG